MTSKRTEELTQHFARWLKRFSVPSYMRSDAQAQQDEANALMGAVLRFAPPEDYMPWVRKVLDNLEYEMKFRSWPTKAELKAACNAFKRAHCTKGNPSPEHDTSPAAMTARAMERGDPVSVNALYGPMAHELLDKKLVGEEQMTAYRTSYWEHCLEVYSREKVEAMRRAQEAAHDRAYSDYKENLLREKKLARQ